MWKQKQNKQIKNRISRQWLTHARTGLRTNNQACMRKKDYAYASPYPENLTAQK